MNYEKFCNLWKVKILMAILDSGDVDDEETITRKLKSSLERDINLIRYGYEEGLKETEEKEENEK